MREIVLSAPQTLDDLKGERWQQESVCALTLAEAAARMDTADAGERADFAECRAYWTAEFPTVSFKTRSIITLMFSMLTRPFTTRPLRRLFCEDTTITPEATFDGRIIIVDLPVQSFRLAGRVAALAWKYCFQVAVMRRRKPEDGSLLRPVFLWADEAQNFVTDKDAEYQAIARSAAGCTVYLSQNRESFRRVLGNDDTVDALLGNLQCKFFCQNSSPDTNEWTAKLLGERYVLIDSAGMQYSEQGGITSENTSEQRRYYVEPSQLATLKRGGEVNSYQVEAIVYNGGYQFQDLESEELVPYRLLTFNQRDARR
jgi:type IV secretory pathway TraG/TraD family ATPase VirD4